jgi:outer membrane biosynthesis protein TonB
MKNLFFLLALLFAANLCAQNTTQQQNDTTIENQDGSEKIDTSYVTIEVRAMYPGGLQKLTQELMDEIGRFYTGRECRLREEISIYVYIKISAKGEISEAGIQKSNCEKLDPIVLAAVKKLKNFDPAMKNGHPVMSVIIIPFAFPK